MKVIKRDGRKVDFDKRKIDKAIDKAFKEVRGVPCPDAEVLHSVSLRIKNQYTDKVEVEQIQDIVEQVLMEKGYYNVAKAYIKYRYEHELARQRHNDSELMEMIRGDNDYWKTENSNKNSKWVTTQRDYMAGIVSTDIARNFIFPKKAIEAHDAGIIHIHK